MSTPLLTIWIVLGLVGCVALFGLFLTRGTKQQQAGLGCMFLLLGPLAVILGPFALVLLYGVWQQQHKRPVR